VTAVLELDALRLAGPWRQGGMEPFKGLDAGLLVRADDVGALLVKARRLCVGLADLPNVGLVLLGVLQLILGSQPVLTLVWAEIPPFRTRSTCLGEMDSTIPRCITSSASSLGVQWVTGRPLSSGTSQATAMICASCSAVTFVVRQN
jgi:hypothetical protein